MSATKEPPNLTDELKNGDDGNTDYEDKAIILNLTKPHKTENGIPPQIIDATDKKNEASGEELHRPSQVNDEKHKNVVRQNSDDRDTNQTNNNNTSLNKSFVEDLNDPRNVEDNKVKDNTTDNSSKLKPVLNNDGHNITNESDESMNVDTGHDVSDEEKFKAFDFSDSDLPDSPEIEKICMSFQKEVITEDPLSETEQESSSDSEGFNPFVFRKKRSKPILRVPVDPNKLPTRISTRYRKPFFENVTAKILKTTYNQHTTTNIRRLKVYNEFKTSECSISDESDLTRKNENISQSKTDDRNNKVKEVSKTNSGSEISIGNSNDLDKHQKENKTKIETLASILPRTTRSNSKISEHKPFDLACTRLQLEINASNDKNRSFYETPEKERSKSPELIRKLRIPQEPLNEVLITRSSLKKPSTRVSISSVSVATRNRPQKTIHRRGIPHDSLKPVSTSFGSVVTRSRLKESPKQVSKPSPTVVKQVRPPNSSKQVSTFSDFTTKCTTPQKSPKQVPKPTETFTRSKSRITSLTQVSKSSDNEVKLSKSREYRKQSVSNSTDAVLTRNRANKFIITSSRPQESAEQLPTLSVLEPLKQELKHPKIVLTRFSKKDYQKKVSASSNCVVTRSGLKESPKQVTNPSKTVVTQVRPTDSPKQISTSSPEATPSKSQKPRKAIPKSSEMILTQGRLRKTTVRRSNPQESQIDVSKSTDTAVTRRRTQESKTQIFTHRKANNTVVTRSKLQKTVKRRSTPQKPIITQLRPQKTVVTKNRLQSLVTQNKVKKSVVTQSKPQKPETQRRSQKTEVARRRLQKTVITQSKPQQTKSIKIPSSSITKKIKRQSKLCNNIIKDSSVKTPKSILKNSSHKQSTACNILSSSKPRRSLKRSLQCCEAPSAKRTKVHKPSITSNKNTFRKI